MPNLFVAVAEAAEERQSAIVLLIGEIQYFNQKELGALIMAMQGAATAATPALAQRRAWIPGFPKN
ncbi:MAG: hypothetical protein O3C21_12300 [Verrucomicrobia bacterium]|nr:hypothetical protein [Verrucomicrobiota bacterium]